MKEITAIKYEITLLKKAVYSLLDRHVSIGGWLPKDVVMKYFNYSETQMRQLEKSNSITVSKIGRRKFYKETSLLKLLEDHIEDDN